jgi:hypothetical protein
LGGGAAASRAALRSKAFCRWTATGFCRRFAAKPLRGTGWDNRFRPASLRAEVRPCWRSCGRDSVQAASDQQTRAAGNPRGFAIRGHNARQVAPATSATRRPAPGRLAMIHQRWTRCLARQSHRRARYQAKGRQARLLGCWQRGLFASYWRRAARTLGCPATLEARQRRWAGWGQPRWSWWPRIASETEPPS